MGAKFGAAANFNNVYIANRYLFPLIAVATSLGVCNLFARSCTFMAPWVAELKPESKAKWVFIFMTAGAMCASIFIVDRKKTEERQENDKYIEAETVNSQIEIK